MSERGLTRGWHVLTLYATAAVAGGVVGRLVPVLWLLIPIDAVLGVLLGAFFDRIVPLKEDADA